MRLRLLLIILLFIPFVAKGQEPTTPNHEVKFFNKGAMYTAPRAGAAANQDETKQREKMVMFIDGSAEFTTGSAVKMADDSGFGLTGDFISSVKVADSATPAVETIFVNTSETGYQKGMVWFANTRKSLVNIPIADNPQKMFSIDFGATGLSLKEKQVIKMTGDTKGQHYIAFPYIAVDSTSYLAIDPSAAVLANGVNVNAASWFTLEAKYSDTNARVLDIGYLKSRGSDGVKRVSTAGIVPNYNASNYNTWYQGRSFLDLKLYNPNKVSGQPAVANGLPGSNLTSGGEVLLTGFTPVQGRSAGGVESGVRADYMFFNTLLDPKPWSLTGSIGPIVDPKFEMKAGKGYFMAMDVTDFDFGEIEGNHPATSHLRRSVGGYQFNRSLLTDSNIDRMFNQFPLQAGTAATVNSNNWVDNNEAFLNMETDDAKSYTVTLSKGLNFLGNPYTSPLDLTEIIEVGSADGATGDEVVTLGAWNNIKVSHNNPAAAEVRNKYWIVGDGRIKHFEEGGKHYFTYNVSYWDSPSAGIGGTLLTATDANGNPVNGGADIGLIAPMQMFALQSSKDNVVIKLPSTRTKFGNTSLRKAVRNEKVDEILLQSVVLGDNNENLMEDRMTIVLRENATLGSNDNTDSRKGLVNARGSAVHGQGGQLTDNGEDPALSYSGIIYSRSSEGVPMLTNTVPTTTKQVAVYFSPTETQQRVRIKPFRMESLQSVKRAWLVDRFENNKEIELTPETEYVFTSRPLTGEQAKENRFILYFDKKPDEIIVDEVLPISVYYNSSIIYIDGLNDGDINSLVQIYDLQGRLMAKTTVTNTPSMQYMKTLSQGTYIVKITGKRNFTTKFITLQN